MKHSGPSSPVVAAAIVGILSSLFAILGSGGAIAGLAMISQTKVAPIPPPVRSLLTVILLISTGLAIFGVFTCIGVLRLKKWARVSILIWGGVLAGVCGLMLPFTLLVPLPEMPADSAATLPYTRILLAVFYGFQFLIGVWWLVLFNQRAVKEQFLGLAPTDGQLVATPLPRCPLPLAILAGFSIISAGFSLFLPFTNLPVNPTLFSYRFQGVIGVILFYVSAGLLLVGSIGMLRLKRWSYPLMLGQYFFWMASGTVTLVSPNYDRNLHDMLSQANLPEGSMGQAVFAQTRVFGILSLIPGVLLIWLMLYFHTRFIQACAAREAFANHSPSLN
jgi:hypothetical protein